MPRTVIVGYRPKPGRASDLDALAASHFARLYALGLVTRSSPLLMRAGDGTLLEVFEWKSQAAIDRAHGMPEIATMWREFAEVCDYVPVGALAEASQLFSGFDSADIECAEALVAEVWSPNPVWRAFLDTHAS